MRRIRCLIFLLVADIIMVNKGVMSTIEESFIAHKLVPDVVSKAPPGLLNVRYPSGLDVLEGNTITPTQAMDAPTISWDASPDDFYTVVFVNIDAPCRTKNWLAEWRHWHVGNIPGNKVEDGEALAEYLPPGPPPETGLHRYVFLVYKQPGKLEFDEPRYNATTAHPRKGFSAMKFAKKYDLGDPVAGNFYYGEFDDFVPINYARCNPPIIWPPPYQIPEEYRAPCEYYTRKIAP